MWGAQELCVASLWRRLHAYLPRELAEQILRVDRVAPPGALGPPVATGPANGPAGAAAGGGRKPPSVRFEIHGSENCVKQVAGALAEPAARARHGWLVRYSESAAVRLARLAAAAPPVPRLAVVADGDQPARRLGEGRRGRAAVATWNINGLSRKLPAVRQYLAEKSVVCLALQETLRSPQSSRLWVPGYRVLEYPGLAPQGPSARGIALVIDQRLSAFEVGSPSPFALFALCTASREDGGGRFIVATIYIPHAAVDKAEAWASVKSQVSRLSRKYAGVPIVACGDWNTPKTALTKRVREELSLHRVNLKGKSVTCTRGRGSKIDHICASKDVAESCGSKGKVDRHWAGGISDHLPVRSRLRGLLRSLRGVEEDEVVAEAAVEWVEGHVWERVQEKTGGGRPKMARLALRFHAEAVATHNRFSALADDLRDVEWVDGGEGGAAEAEIEGGVAAPIEGSAGALRQAADRFITEAWEVARETPGVLPKLKGGAGPNRALAKGTRDAISRHRVCYREWRAAMKPVELRRRQGGAGASEAEQQSIKTLKAAFQQARREARAADRRERRRAWLGSVRRGVRSAWAGDAAEYWRFVKRASLGGWGGRAARSSGSASQPVLHPDSGELVRDPVKIGDAWALHFGRLCADPEGVSCNPEHWEVVMEELRAENEALQGSARRGLSAIADGRRAAPLPTINDPITYPEVEQTVRTALLNKAEGLDGLSAEFLKTMLPTQPRGADDPIVPCNPLGEIILSLMNGMFMTGAVTHPVWAAAAVVAIPKKGDKANMNNYRGISLIAVTVKLVSVLLAKRLSLAAEKAGLLRKEQAGFRSMEECVAQATALREIVDRRLKEGETTYLCFIDLKKAFDTVPHEGLFAKLDTLGIRGRALRFIRGLYASSRITVRGEFGLSPEVPLLRGVRQGCPLSPLLFDLFINDSLDGCAQNGVKIAVRYKQERHARVPGLMFADDVVLMSGRKEKLGKSMDNFSDWCERWRMAVGVKKCGLMAVGGGQRSQDRLNACHFQLQGQPVPCVEEYPYLGILFTRTWDMKKAIDDRVGTGEAALRKGQKFYHNHSLPIALRLMHLRGCVLSTGIYGAEVWGPIDGHTRGAQSMWMRGLRAVAGVGKSCSGATLRAELGMQSVKTLVTARRERALAKFPSLRTWVADVFVGKPPRGGGTSSQQRGERALKKLVYQPDGSAVPCEGIRSLPLAILQHAPALAAENNKEYIITPCLNRRKAAPVAVVVGTAARLAQLKEEAQDTTLAFAHWQKMELHLTRGYLADALFRPEIASGVRDLLRLRVADFWSARRLARRFMIAPEWYSSCPHCRQSVGEDEVHMLLHCSAWAEERQTYLADLLTQIHEETLLASGGVGGIGPCTVPLEIAHLLLGAAGVRDACVRGNDIVWGEWRPLSGWHRNRSLGRDLLAGATGVAGKDEADCDFGAMLEEGVAPLRRVLWSRAVNRTEERAIVNQPAAWSKGDRKDPGYARVARFLMAIGKRRRARLAVLRKEHQGPVLDPRIPNGSRGSEE